MLWRPRATSRVAGRLWRREDTPEPVARATEQSHEPDSCNTRPGEMHPLAQRVARAQHRNQAARQRLDHRHLEREAGVADAGRKSRALLEQLAGARGEPLQALAERRCARRFADVLDRRASSSQCIAGNVDAVEIAIILLAVLQVID